MSPAFYHIAHVLGVMVLFAGFGGLLTANGNRGRAMMLHGIGLILMLVSGFGMIAKLKIPYTAHWIIGMFVIWIILGALPVLEKRKVLPGGAVFVIAAVLGVVAAYFGYLKPTF